MTKVKKLETHLKRYLSESKEAQYANRHVITQTRWEIKEELGKLLKEPRYI